MTNYSLTSDYCSELVKFLGNNLQNALGFLNTLYKERLNYIYVRGV